jgi:hypothetical protein
MFNDKLHICTYKNTIYQSKLKLLPIFGQSGFSSTVRFSDIRYFHQQTDFVRAQFIIQRRSYLAWLELFRENHFSVFLAVLDEFLLTSVQSWEKNSDLKNLKKS